jgi:hypothetical protein
VFGLVSAMNEKSEKALVPKPPSAVEKAVPGVNRILSGMVIDTLAQATSKQRSPMLASFRIGDYEWCEPDYRQILIWAEETGLKPEEVIARLFDQQSLPVWEEDDQHSYPVFETPLFADGRLLKVNFDLRLLRNPKTARSPHQENKPDYLEKITAERYKKDKNGWSVDDVQRSLMNYSPEQRGRLEWVNGLEMTHLRIIGASDVASLSNLGPLPLARLEVLDCRRLGLTHIDLTGVPQLQFLDCRYNQLERLRFDQTPNLKYLYCDNNVISELDLSPCPNLITVGCSGNPILDIHGLEQLEHLLLLLLPFARAPAIWNRIQKLHQSVTILFEDYYKKDG